VREAVLEAAAEIFVERGFEGASIDQIAQRAGVSKPTIYSHFGGKEQLFTEILTAVGDDLASPMLRPGAEEADLESILLEIARAYARAVLNPRVVELHRLFVGEAERFPELSRRYFAAGPQMAHDSLAAFLAARIRRGDLKPADPATLAEFFASLIINPMRLRLLFRMDEQVDWEAEDRRAALAIRLFLDGAAAPPAGDRPG